MSSEVFLQLLVLNGELNNLFFKQGCINKIIETTSFKRFILVYILMRKGGCLLHIEILLQLEFTL